ncbi:MAG: CarD family transcriptional regulator, partial [Methylocystis sp.]|nr:CarD family transcriptional regulator [Methylocystis sp.]
MSRTKTKAPLKAKSRQTASVTAKTKNLTASLAKSSATPAKTARDAKAAASKKAIATKRAEKAHNVIAKAQETKIAAKAVMETHAKAAAKAADNRHAAPTGARQSSAASAAATPVAGAAVTKPKVGPVESGVKAPVSKPDGAAGAKAPETRPALLPSARPTAPAPVAKAKPPQPKLSFKHNEYIVYPAHGVGQIIGIEVQEVAGFSLELFVVSFIKDKMILKVPTSKVSNVGMRKLSDHSVVDKALATLSGRARIKRTMWSRRAQEYEAKINSGDLVSIAEGVRDLHRAE